VGLGAAAFAAFTSGVTAQRDNATYIPTEEIMTFYRIWERPLISRFAGLILVMTSMSPSESLSVLVRARKEMKLPRLGYWVTEVNYVLEGSGILVTGGDESDAL